VIDVGGGSIQFEKSDTPYFLNNRSAGGQPQHGFDASSQLFHSDLQTRIEDAVVLSL